MKTRIFAQAIITVTVGFAAFVILHPILAMISKLFALLIPR